MKPYYISNTISAGLLALLALFQVLIDYAKNLPTADIRHQQLVNPLRGEIVTVELLYGSPGRKPAERTAYTWWIYTPVLASSRGAYCWANRWQFGVSSGGNEQVEKSYRISPEPFIEKIPGF